MTPANPSVDSPPTTCAVGDKLTVTPNIPTDATNPFVALPQLSVGTLPKPAYPASLDTDNPLTDSMELCCLLNEGSGTTAHDLAGGVTGSLVNGAPWTSKGVAFSSASSQYIDLGNPAQLQITDRITVMVAFTLSAFTPGNNSNIIFGKDSSSGGRAYTVDIYDSKIWFYVNGNGGSNNGVHTSYNITTGTRYVVAGIFDSGGLIALYVNGSDELPASQLIPGATSIPASTAKVEIGRRDSSGSEAPIDGEVEFAYIWNRTLHPAEIATLTNNPYQILVGGNPAPTTVLNPNEWVRSYMRVLEPGNLDWASATIRPVVWVKPMKEVFAGQPTPGGNFGWQSYYQARVRGVHTARIEVLDDDNPVSPRVSDVFTFTATAATNPKYRGRVRVSPTEPTMFEFTSTGKAWIMSDGLNEDDDSKNSVVATAGPATPIRKFYQGSNGPMAPHNWNGQGGRYDWDQGTLVDSDYGDGGRFDLQVHYNDPEFAEVRPCGGDNTTANYQITVTFKTTGITGPANPLDPDYGVEYGFKFQYQDFDAGYIGTGPRRSILGTPVHGTTGWQTLTGTLTSNVPNTGNNFDFLNHLEFGVFNATAGSATVHSISVRQVMADMSLGPELMNHPTMDFFRQFGQAQAYRIDKSVDSAIANDLYINAVVNEAIDGLWLSLGGGDFYGPMDPGETNSLRTWQDNYAWYFLGRWGWSANIYSMEFCNEGEPYYQFGAANHFADFVHACAPDMLCTASMSGDEGKQTQQWSNPLLKLDFATLHRYADNFADDGRWNFGFIQSTGSEWIDDPDGLNGKVIHVAGQGNAVANIWALMYGAPVTPGSTYTVKYRQKGVSVASDLSHAKGDGACVWLGITDGRDSPLYTWDFSPCANLVGTFAWANKETPPFTIPPDFHWCVIKPAANFCTGDVYYKNIILCNKTTGAEYPLINHTFDGELEIYDDMTSLALDWHQRVGGGGKADRIYPFPVVVNEWGNYEGPPTNNESPDLLDDVDGIWYRHTIWANGVRVGIAGSNSWYKNAIYANNLLHINANLKKFLGNDRINNGDWVNIDPAITGGLEAYGSMDSGTGKTAHVWVRNPAYASLKTIKAPASGTKSGNLTIANIPDGAYTVQAWNTLTGSKADSVIPATGGSGLVIPIASMGAQDMAFRVTPGSSSGGGGMGMGGILIGTGIGPTFIRTGGSVEGT